MKALSTVERHRLLLRSRQFRSSETSARKSKLKARLGIMKIMSLETTRLETSFLVFYSLFLTMLRLLQRILI